MGKILILTNNDAGLYEFRKEVVSAIIEAGNEVFISVPDTGYIDKLRALGAEIIPTELDRRGMNPARDIKLFSTYRRILKEINPDVVLGYTIKPNVYGGVACRSMKTPFMATVTGLGSTLQGSGPVQQLVKAMYRAGLRGVACVFFQNEYNMQFMKEKGCISKDTHTRLIAGSGVNIEEHKYREYPECPSTHFLYVGRIMDDKGSSELLEAAERVHKKHPNVVVDIIGSFEEETRDKYEPWINRLVEDGAVVYHGYRDDVDTFYTMCNALVHPSYHEGMSNVVLEAAASGRPVLTSDIPGCKEAYENGSGGIAYSPRSTDALESAMLQFLELSHDEMKSMGVRARDYIVDKFDRKLVVQAYLAEIDRCTSKMAKT